MLATGMGLSTASAQAPQPKLWTILPAGGQAGTTVQVKLHAGKLLEGVDRLIFSHPGISAKRVMTEPDRFFPEPRPVEGAFQVQIADNVPPGIYNVRAASPVGVSNVRRFVVGHLPEVVEEEDNDTLEEAQSIEPDFVVNGLAERGQRDYFRITLKQGQTVALRCVARELDANGDALLAVLDAEGRELKRRIGTMTQDPYVAFTAPADGDYFVRLQELTFGNYRDATDCAYRLEVSNSALISFVDPPFLERGKSNRVTLYGRNLGGQPSDVREDGKPLQRLDVTIDAPTEASGPQAAVMHPSAASLDLMSYIHQQGEVRSNEVLLALNDGPLTEESEPNNRGEEAQEIAAEASVVGTFGEPGDQDWYQFTAQADSPLWIEIDSARLGAPTNPMIVVQQVTPGDEGEVQVRDVATNAQRELEVPGLRLNLGTLDPALLFKPPADGTYRLLVRDLFGSSQGGPAMSYRLRIGPPHPNFCLLAVAGDAELQGTTQRRREEPGSIQLAPGSGREVVLAVVRSGGFDGEIEVHAESLPPGLTAEPAIVGPAGTFSALVVQASGDAKPVEGPLKIFGTAKIDGKQIRREAAGVEILWENQDNSSTTPLRLSRGLTIAVQQRLVTPARVELAEDKPLRMARGGKLEIPLKLVNNSADFQGNVTVGVASPPNRELRPQTVALSAGKAAGKLAVDVDTDVPPGRYSLVLRGEVDVDYQHMPELAEQAKEDQKRLDQIQKDSEEAYKQAVNDRQQAEREASQAANEKNNATNGVNSARQQAQQAEQRSKQAADQAAQAQKAADDAAKQAKEAADKVAQAADEAAKKSAQQAAEQAQRQADQAKAAAQQAAKQADQAAEQARQAADELAKREAELKAAEEKLAVAEKAKQAAMEKEQTSKQERDEAVQAKREIDQVASTTARTANKRKVKLPVYAPTLALEIVPYPAEISVGQEKLTVTAGQEVELPLAAKRDFGFDGEIEVQLRPPSGVGGLSTKKGDKFGKGNDTKLVIGTSENTPAGEHRLGLNFRMRFNNRTLEQEQEVTLVVKPAPKKEK